MGRTVIAIEIETNEHLCGDGCPWLQCVDRITTPEGDACVMYCGLFRLYVPTVDGGIERCRRCQAAEGRIDGTAK